MVRSFNESYYVVQSNSVVVAFILPSPSIILLSCGSLHSIKTDKLLKYLVPPSCLTVYHQEMIFIACFEILALSIIVFSLSNAFN